MSGNDAAHILGELGTALSGALPQTRTWLNDLNLTREPLRGSWNKPPAAAACEAMLAHMRNDVQRMNECLDWLVWFSGLPFMGGEAMATEELYRLMPAYAFLGAAGIAQRRGHSGYTLLIESAKAHAAWLLLGSGRAPARKISDHQLDKVGQNVVLVGNGPPVCSLHGICQAGMRSWVRNREDGPAIFLFTDRIALSVTVAQALGLPYGAREGKNERAFYEGLMRTFPELPPWGFSTADRALGTAFYADPASASLARRVYSWVEHHLPSMPYTLARHADGAAWSLLRESRDSSTDAVLVDVLHADGTVFRTSAGTGARDGGGGQIEAGKAWEDVTRLYCQDAAGGEVMSTYKPATQEAWRIEADGSVSRFIVNGITAPAAPQPAPAPPPQPKKKKKKRRWWEFWK